MLCKRLVVNFTRDHLIYLLVAHKTFYKKINVFKAFFKVIALHYSSVLGFYCNEQSLSEML